MPIAADVEMKFDPFSSFRFLDFRRNPTVLLRFSLPDHSSSSRLIFWFKLKDFLRIWNWKKPLTDEFSLTCSVGGVSDGNKTVHRQDNSPTRFWTVHQHIWRQFTDTFEDSSSTLFYHIRPKKNCVVRVDLMAEKTLGRVGRYFLFFAMAHMLDDKKRLPSWEQFRILKALLRVHISAWRYSAKHWQNP